MKCASTITRCTAIACAGLSVLGHSLVRRLGLVLLSSFVIGTSAPAVETLPPVATRLSVGADEIVLVRDGVLRCRFVKKEDQSWKIASVDVWEEPGQSWHESFTSTHGEFLHLGATPDFESSDPRVCLFGDSFEKISAGGTTGVKFAGVHDLNGVPFRWFASYFFDDTEKMPLLHCEITYQVGENIKLGCSPKVVCRTIASDASEQSTMTHIMSYEPSDKASLIERGYPLIWLNSKIGSRTYNSLLINDVRQDSPDGRYFKFNRSPKAPHFAYWLIGSLKKWDSEHAKHYWNYRDPETGQFPEETDLIANKEYKLKYEAVFGLNYSNLEFYRRHWSDAFDHVCPMEKVPFWATNWAECAQGVLEEFKDNDANEGDRYVDGVGYYSAPKKDKMSHGAGNVCWHGTAEIAHGMMYYAWATGNQSNFDFYSNRLVNANLPKWAENTAGNKGWINETWIAGQGYAHWSSMWATLDIGAHSLFRCYKLTGDKTYWNLYKRLLDYVRTDLIKDRKTLGEHWIDTTEQWHYFTPESAFRKTQAVEQGHDPGDYPGSLSVYAYLCLLAYAETQENVYRESAFSYIDHINTFLSRPQHFWTLCRTPKPNAFAFACLANVRRYEITHDERFLDHAEEWAFLMLSMYHLRDESGHEIGLAHASGLGVQDYVCVGALETIEPLVLISSFLKHRVSPSILKYLALADRRHLIVYPKNHPDKKFDYPFTPMELVPQRDSFAMYMAGAPMIENVMFHALHDCTDQEVTVVCLDAAESSLDVKTRRTMIAYNPTLKSRTFNVTLKGINAGLYQIKGAQDAPIEISADTLQGEGIKLNLKPQEWVKLEMQPSN